MSIFKKRARGPQGMLTTDYLYQLHSELASRVDLLYGHFGLKKGLVSSRADFDFSDPDGSVRRIVKEEKD